MNDIATASDDSRKDDDQRKTIPAGNYFCNLETTASDQFHCCHCGHKLTSDHAKDQTVSRCPHCGRTFYARIERLYITRSIGASLKPSAN